MTAWFLTFALILSAYPWAAYLVRDEQDDAAILTRLVLTITLSSGALSLIMFGQAALGLRLEPLTITLPYLALMLIGAWRWWSTPQPRLSFSRPNFVIFIPILLVALAVLFNAVYWPFSRDDTLAIYHHYGSLLAQTRALVPFQGRDEAFYQAYPQLMSMLYAYSYMISGWQNEYLARLWPALLSLANLPIIYLLGRRMTQRTPATLAVLFFVAMPAFARWASSGYVDLPMAFFYALNAYFTWKYTVQPSSTSAALAGLSIGLAAWTKNAAFFGIGLWLLWLAVLWWQKRISLRLIALSVLICFGVCGAWYIRNWLEIGLFIPPTAWVDKAEHSLRTFFAFVTLPENFALSGWLITLACGAALIAFLRGKLPLHRQFLLLYTLPFFIIWWWTTSYDPRFILLFLPLLSVLAGDWFDHLTPKPSTRLSVYAIVIVFSTVLTLYNTWIAVEFKDDILRQPMMSDAAKHEVVQPP